MPIKRIIEKLRTRNEMKKIIILSVFSFLIIACQKNSLPTISRRTSEPPPPAPLARKDLKVDLEKGKTVFTNRCGRCHGLHDPKEFTAEKWDVILQRMVPRARLNPEDAADVEAYIKANSK
jgi:mono/diheme cytochrome c family protein